MKLRQIIIGKDDPQPRDVIVTANPLPRAYLREMNTNLAIPAEHFAAVLAADDQWEALLSVVDQGGIDFRPIGPEAFVLGVMAE